MLVSDVTVVGLLLPDSSAEITGDDESPYAQVPQIAGKVHEHGYSRELKYLSPLRDRGVTAMPEKPATLPRENKIYQKTTTKGKGVFQRLGSVLSAERPSSASSLAGSVTTVNVATTTQATQARSLNVAIQAPAVVRGGEDFDLKIKVNYQPGAGSLLSLVLQKPVRVDINVIAEGFTAPEGKQRTATLGPGGARTSVTIPLVAPAPSRDVNLARLAVLLSSQGQTVGMLSHRLGVVSNGVRPSDAPSITLVPWIRHGDLPPTDLNLPEDDEAPDLTVSFVGVNGKKGDESKFALEFVSPHPFQPPVGDVFIDLGKDTAETFAIDFIRLIDSNQSYRIVNNYLESLGDKIAKCLPKEFWRILNEVQALVKSTRGGPMTLWLKSSEYHLPWELAFIGAPFRQ